MRRLLFVVSVLLFSTLSASSFAQSEPQPEVDVDCVNLYSIELYSNPRGYETMARIECTLNNQNAYQVEVETNLEWIYSESHDESTTTAINGNSEVVINFEVWATEDAPAGIEGLTFEATVTQYGGIRECSGCETTSSNLDLTILEWTTVDLQQISQSHRGIFGGDYVTEPCTSGEEYTLNATMSVQANHKNVNAAVGFSTIIYQYVDFDYYFFENTEEFISETPDMIRLDAKAGESSDISIVFSLEDYENQTDDMYIIFVVFYGEEYYVNDALQAPSISDYYDDESFLEFYYGGCYIGGEVMQDGFEEINPIIIETSSDGTAIYLIAGIGISLAACLAVVLIVILVRRGNDS